MAKIVVVERNLNLIIICRQNPATANSVPMAFSDLKFFTVGQPNLG
jgi:hypothetical protein